MTLQEAVNYVLGNLGGRFDGFVGPENSQDAALREINFAVQEISKSEDAPEWERVYDFSLVSGESSFPLPVINGQRVRTIPVIQYQISQSWYPMQYMEYDQFMRELYGQIDLTTSPYPKVYTYFGNTIYFFPRLSQDTNFKSYLALYPPKFTSADLPNEIEIDPDWDTSIIAYATFKLFLRLQQDEDFRYWKSEYRECMKTAKHALRKRRMEIRVSADQTIHPRVLEGDPARNPFVKSW